LNPIVSICIANYNGARFISECINSVLEQIDPPSFEIIVHDDGSTDTSLEILRSIVPIRLIESGSNVGFCVANNRMAAEAHGKYLLLLNNDAFLFPDALRAMYDAAREDQSDPVLSTPQYDYASGALLDRGLMLDLFANPVPITDAKHSEPAMVMGACLWISARLWKQLEGFPEWLGSIGEDLFLCCHARLSGHPIRVTAGSGYRHMVGSSFGGGKTVNSRIQTTVRRRSLSERNKTFVLITFFPAAILFLLLPLHFLALVVEGAILACLKRNHHILTDIYIAAIRDSWRYRRQLIAARTRVRSTRCIKWSAFRKAIRLRPRKLELAQLYGVPEIF
jgi:GT2 family glycosyltransferase